MEQILNQNLTSGQEQKISCLIDYVSVIFENTSFNAILRFLKMDPNIYVSDFLQTECVQTYGCMYWFGFAFEGVQLTADNYVPDDEKDAEIFDRIFSKIRCNISGSGLCFLRGIGFEIAERCNPDLWFDPETGEKFIFHMTRCDFAFDLINYKSDFLDKCIEHCRNHHTDADRIALMNGSGLRYSYRLGDQKTLYLGSPRSDKLLRIYDKRLEYIDSKSKAYIRDNPYSNPDSWIRVEWQTRNAFSHGWFFSKYIDGHFFEEVQFISILRQIYENYCFSDMTSKYWKRQPAPFWHELFDWDLIPRIIYNNKFEIVKLFSERVDSYVEKTAVTNVLLYIGMHGMKKFLKVLTDRLDLFNNVDSIKDSCRREIVYRQKKAFLSKMNLCEVERSLSFLSVLQGNVNLYVDVWDVLDIDKEAYFNEK